MRRRGFTTSCDDPSATAGRPRDMRGSTSGRLAHRVLRSRSRRWVRCEWRSGHAPVSVPTRRTSRRPSSGTSCSWRKNLEWRRAASLQAPTGQKHLYLTGERAPSRRASRRPALAKSPRVRRYSCQALLKGLGLPSIVTRPPDFATCIHLAKFSNEAGLRAAVS